jgi:DNA-binding CsgD family transcriptional regulator
VDTVKIDKSFIQGISTNSSESKALISTIITLAHVLKMSVIGEGVETQEQLDVLKEYKCEEMQGYLFSPPILPTEFETLLLANTNQDNAEDAVFLNNEQVAAALPLSPKGIIPSTEINENKEILAKALDSIKVLYSISTREMDVFELIVKGLSNKEISDKLFISEHTVKNHITKILQKLNVHDRLQAMAKVYQTCLEEGENLRIH